MRPKLKENPIKELSALQMLGPHENVIGFRESCQDYEHFYLVMDFYNGGELYDVVEKNGALPEDAAKKYFQQVVRGLMHLHKAGVAHRDVSLENVLCDKETGKCVLIDFGMCIRFTPSSSSSPSSAPMLPFAGSHGKRTYIAPELVAREPFFDPIKVDVWALGIMLFILLTGVPPFECASPQNLAYSMLKDGQLEELLSGWNFHLSSAAIDMLQKILNPDPSTRFGLSDILAHPWLA